MPGFPPPSLPALKKTGFIPLVGSCLSASGLCLVLSACMQATTGTQNPAPLLAAAAKPATKWDEFHRSVQPFLAKHCFECHGDENAENGFRLDGIRDEASLEKSSGALDKVLEKLASHKMPPRDEPQPAATEVVPVVDWLKVHLAGDPNGPINPGRVTLRRLNRAEYNNTIRDLLAIELRPADTFPADDTGYGFDNNGDVLTLAPVLMEKYLSAATLALDKAIFSDPVLPPPVKSWDAAVAEGTFPKSDPKAVSGRAPYTVPIGRLYKFASEIYADYDVPVDGEYIVRMRGYGTQGSVTKQRPQAAFLVDGKMIQKPFTVAEDLRNPASDSLEKTPLTAGRHRISLAFVNGATPEEYAIAQAKADAEGPRQGSLASADPNADDDVDDKPKPAAGARAGRRGGGPGRAGQKPAADKADNAAATAVVADNAPAVGAAKAPGRDGAVAGRANGAPGMAAPIVGSVDGRRPPELSPTGKPTLGVISFDIEGPMAPTPDRMPESYRRVMIAHPSATVTKPEAAEKIIRHFATRAYRRPAQDSEVSRLMAVWAKADSDGRPFERSIDHVLKAVLVSPAFLFRMELDPQPGETGNIHTLNEYELASRLSYFLWASMPDDELFAMAEQGKLRANLDAQVRRMLKDPKSSALVENFAGQWLQLRTMATIAPDSKHFPEFDEALRDAMTKETQLYFNAIVQEDRNVMDFVDSDFTYVNERLAKHYGLAGVTGNEFRRVSLPKDQRGGILTQASILTITSYPARTSPVQRGKWVLENLLDAAPPPPPPNVPALVEGEKAELTGTLRQRMERHRADPKCATCHAQMDGIGFALENFDAIGAWRTQDGNDAIDAKGTLPGGKSFNGPAELRAIIKSQSDEFCRCMANKMLTFALGRGLQAYDRRTSEAIVEAMKKNGNKFSTMIEEIVRSEAFQKRNGKPERGDS